MKSNPVSCNWGLSQGLITQLKSAWAAPIVVARRKNGQMRLAIDYRALNTQTFDQHHPIPQIDDLIDRLWEAKYFSFLDFKSGYYQMNSHEEDSELTGFVAPDGHFQWTCQGTPFGLSGAPAYFQRLMSGVLGSLNWKVALFYLDDILVWGTTWTEHIQRLRQVLQRLQEVGMLLNPEKCTFGVRRIEFLGHVMGKGMLSINEARRQALINTPKPTTVTMLRKALGAFSHVRRWIPGRRTLQSHYTIFWIRMVRKCFNGHPRQRTHLNGSRYRWLNLQHFTFQISIDPLC